MQQLILNPREHVKFGFPYNDPVDDLFTSLDSEYIQINGLSLDNIVEVAELKNDLMLLDEQIYQDINQLSTDIYEFDNYYASEIQDQVTLLNDYIIEQANFKKLEAEYQEILNYTNELLNSKKILETDLSNIQQLQQELEMSILGLDNNIDIDKMNEELSNATDVLLNAINDLDYNLITVEAQHDNLILEYQQYIQNNNNYNFFETTLLEYYRIWSERSELNNGYNILKSIFAEQYEYSWGNYGRIVDFDNYIDNSRKLLININESQKKIQEIKFNIIYMKNELTTTLYLIDYLKTRSSFDIDTYAYQKQYKLHTLYTESLQNIETELLYEKKQFSIYNEHDNKQGYDKYIENVNIYFQEAYKNVLDGNPELVHEFANDFIDEYIQYNNLTFTFDYIKHSTSIHILEQIIYDIRSRLKQIDDVLTYVERRINNNVVDPSDTTLNTYLERDNFYKEQEAILLDKIDDINNVIKTNDVVITTALNDLEKSKIFLLSIDDKIVNNNESYIKFILSRINIFTDTQNQDVDSQLVDLINKKTFKPFKLAISSLFEKLYENNHFDNEKLNVLERYYGELSSTFENMLLLEFERELAVQLFDKKYISLLELNINNTLILIFANIIKMQQTTNNIESNYNDIQTQIDFLFGLIDVIEKYLVRYPDIILNIKNDIYNYNNYIEYDIGTISIFRDYVQELASIANNILKQITTEQDVYTLNKKIDLLWANMGDTNEY